MGVGAECAIADAVSAAGDAVAVLGDLAPLVPAVLRGGVAQWANRKLLRCARGRSKLFALCEGMDSYPRLLVMVHRGRQPASALELRNEVSPGGDGGSAGGFGVGGGAGPGGGKGASGGGSGGDGVSGGGLGGEGGPSQGYGLE